MKKTWQCVISVLLMLAGHAVIPQDHASGMSQEATAWIATVVDIKGDAATARSWERQLRAIDSVIKAAPAFGDLKEYYPLISLLAEPPNVGKGPWVGFVVFDLWTQPWVIIDPSGKPTLKPNFRYNRPGGLWIGINTRRDLSHWHGGKDQVGRFYVLPEIRREIAGFPVFGDRFFIAKSDRLPFDPLSLERALRWIVGDLRRQVKVDEDGLASAKRAYEEFMSPAGLERRRKEIEAAAASQKKPDNQAQARKQAETIDRRREQDLRDATVPKPGSPQALTAALLAGYEKRLATLSPHERTQPAWISEEPRVRGCAGTLVPANTAGARPLVVESAFFDPALPPDAMQLVTVPYELEDRMKSPITSKDPRNYVPFGLVERTDWRAVQKLLK